MKFGFTSSQRKTGQTVRYCKCQQCLNKDSIQVVEYLGRGDIVVCQECGATYQIQSRRPFFLQLVEPSGSWLSSYPYID